MSTEPPPPGDATAELARLARRHPGYRLWMEGRRNSRPRYVAQRIPGSAANLVAVVTPDLAELRAVLAGSR